MSMIEYRWPALLWKAVDELLDAVEKAAYRIALPQEE
jgi:hypothetical protein